MPSGSITRRHCLAAAAALAAAPVSAQGAGTRVRLETDKGTMVLELADGRAPVTAANFLQYVDTGRMESAVFFRAPRARLARPRSGWSRPR